MPSARVSRSRARPARGRRSKPAVPFFSIGGPDGSHMSRNMSHERSRLIAGRSQWRSRFHRSTTWCSRKYAVPAQACYGIIVTGSGFATRPFGTGRDRLPDSKRVGRGGSSRESALLAAILHG